MVNYIGIILFLIGACSLLFVSLVILLNGATYKVNQLFFTGFLGFFLYYLFMGAYFFPDVNFTGVNKYLLAFSALVFLNISLVLFASASIYIEHGMLKGNYNKLSLIVMMMILGILFGNVLTQSLAVNDVTLALITFFGMDTCIMINTGILTYSLIRVYQEAKDYKFKNKIKWFCINFLLLGVLSISGWTITLFITLPKELSTMPPVVATFIASLLLVNSFRSKITSNPPM